ncbi:hypothetical protein PPACK8108_LOCUS24228 [Phakopsora pachyrhizi]|uniref:Translation initiation factor IF- 2 domain-containing protein n=1 Tax=Phakopsora pachyrhizi TaxID=170000 RepID=A0AAV0BR53_PHAPC|nr:hypothetical protein PPACK8108_LOCUS24228 [Phakopsora pachyrhizi]
MDRRSSKNNSMKRNLKERKKTEMTENRGESGSINCGTAFEEKGELVEANKKSKDLAKNPKEFRSIVKSDCTGTVKAVKAVIKSLDNQQVTFKLSVSDVGMEGATKGMIVGFNLKIDKGAYVMIGAHISQSFEEGDEKEQVGDNQGWEEETHMRTMDTIKGNEILGQNRSEPSKAINGLVEVLGPSMRGMELELTQSEDWSATVNASMGQISFGAYGGHGPGHHLRKGRQSKALGVD